MIKDKVSVWKKLKKKMVHLRFVSAFFFVDGFGFFLPSFFTKGFFRVVVEAFFSCCLVEVAIVDVVDSTSDDDLNNNNFFLKRFTKNVRSQKLCETHKFYV